MTQNELFIIKERTVQRGGSTDDLYAVIGALEAAWDERDLLRGELSRARELLLTVQADPSVTVGRWSGEPRIVRPCRLCGGRTVRESGVCLACAAREAVMP